MREGWTCSEARSAFSAAWDGELEVAAGAALQAHLERCPGCRDEKARQDRELELVSQSMLRLVAGERPQRPFPDAPARRRGWLGLAGLRPAALVFSGLAVGFVALEQHRRGLILPPTETLVSVSPAREAGPCPWHVARPEEVARTVSYPVVADPCLGAGFELVEARVQTDSGCAEGVRLTYRSGARTLVLEQHPLSPAASCPAERVVVDRVAGCLEQHGAGATALVWTHGDQGFRLEGDVAPGEAVAFAGAISESLEGI